MHGYARACDRPTGDLGEHFLRGRVLVLVWVVPVMSESAQQEGGREDADTHSAMSLPCNSLWGLGYSGQMPAAS
eukprot:3386039-Rhodomonas_salina.2